jgi:hypothetical protein
MQDLSFNLLQQEIEYVSLNHNFQDAFEAHKIIMEWLTKNDIKKNDFSVYLKYLGYLNKLKFLCLNYFDNVNDYAELLKNDFSLIFEIPDFDLWDKIEIYLVAISDVKRRDAVKEKLKAALFHCENNLIDISKYSEGVTLNKVSDWLKDFIASLGLNKIDSVKKNEYLMNGKYTKSLKADDKERVKILLDIYEKLNLSSQTKEGYENTVLMELDGKDVIFNHGELEDVKPLNVKSGRMLVNDILADKKSSTSMPATTIKESPVVISSSSKLPITPEKPTTIEKQIIPRTTELEEILDSYSPASLEYKAISQEIMRLKKTEARKNAKR